MAREKFEDKLNRLGLEAQLAAKYADFRAFQVALAERLREVAMASVKGTLVDRSGQRINSPTADAMRAQLESGLAAERDWKIYPMAARPSPGEPIPANALYIEIPAEYNGTIIYETALSEGRRVMNLDSLRGQFAPESAKLDELNLAVGLQSLEKLAAFQDNIEAITYKEHHTTRGDSPEGSLNAYLRDQMREGAWATYASLVALGDALDVNVVLCDFTPEGRVKSQQTLNNTSYELDKPTVYVTGGKGHWDAVVDCKTDATGKVLSGRKVKAEGDGNCGYNAIAIGLDALTGSRNALAHAPAVSVPTARSPSSTEKVTKAEPWKARLKSIFVLENEVSRKAEMERIQKATTGDESTVRQKILEKQQAALQAARAALPEHLRQLTDTGSKKPTEGAAPRVLTAEQERIEKQIEADEKLAWELAAQEALNDDESAEDSSPPTPR